jgi:hypothetical protein
MQTPSDLIFQAAVEAPLSHMGRDYTVTVVAERAGLDEADVVIDFRVLEAALDKTIKVIETLAPLRGRGIQELGTDAAMDAARLVAEAIALSVAPSVPPPAALASVSLQDGAGRRVTVKK